MLWSDNMLIPNKATHKKNAEQLINYYYDPKVVAAVEEYVNYICPVKGVQGGLEKIDPDAGRQPADLPGRSRPWRKSHVFRGARPEDGGERSTTAQFQTLIGG